MIKVLFFAQTRELIGIDELNVEEQFLNVEALRQYLASQGDKWALALDKERLLVAINQTLATLESVIENGDEVAFFPPVTGG